jgi:hypothetical protein
LRQISAETELPNTGTKCLSGVKLHLEDCRRMMTMNRQTISSITNVSLSGRFGPFWCWAVTRGTTLSGCSGLFSAL